jgi:hypothetical protein
MNKLCSSLIIAIIAALTLTTPPTTAQPATLIGPDPAALVVAVRNVT